MRGHFTQMCSVSGEGSNSRLVDFVCASTLGLRVIKKKKKKTMRGSICIVHGAEASQVSGTEAPGFDGFGRGSCILLIVRGAKAPRFRGVEKWQLIDLDVFD